MFFLLFIFIIAAIIWQISFRIVLPVILGILALEFIFWVIRLLFGLILLPFNWHLLVPLIIVALIVWIWKNVRRARRY